MPCLRINLSLFILLPSLASTATILNTVQVPTECKTCPYTLCPNKAAYSNSQSITLSCWTEGTNIVDDTTWLKSQDNCFVTQYDLLEYPGDYTTALPSCGDILPSYTRTTARTRYMTDCYFTPAVNEKRLAPKHYKYGIDLPLLCTAHNRSALMGRTTWFKTPSNCYVHETTLWDVEDADELDDCGPLPPGLTPDDHVPETTTTTSSVVAKQTGGVREKGSRTGTGTGIGKRWLYNTTIGEEYVNCTEKASVMPSQTRRVYEFGQAVVPQCATWGDSERGNGTGIIFLFTTDFSYVRDWETDPGLREDFYRENYYPPCEWFTDTES
ncbi:hypothetical protein BU26DRAFT_571501 [Trematosphaeria pertusa]|uniref:Ig-like domain-containing protein n=1 Tax=Trematosphaeria pertusa TaxID=390896 RepID=A0A6A6HWH9_9PLEO|nr:uncharacterized protein BU26DRAFT_571501 [Trematosphaeria pertusa]KAF2241750.1 hypothetical protein BU26DRAFT_571501 [Trematosphaeria pertusa]